MLLVSRDQKPPQRDPDPRLQLYISTSLLTETFTLRRQTTQDMLGFVPVLAAFALLSVGFRSAGAELEMRSSAVPAVQRAAAGLNSSGDEVGGAGRTSCPGRCRCEVDGLLHWVDCSDLGLREIPSNLSVFTSYL